MGGKWRAHTRARRTAWARTSACRIAHKRSRLAGCRYRTGDISSRAPASAHRIGKLVDAIMMMRGASRQCRGEELEEAARSNVKPAAGFTLPAAGVTPAPSVKKVG